MYNILELSGFIGEAPEPKMRARANRRNIFTLQTLRDYRLKDAKVKAERARPS